MASKPCFITFGQSNMEGVGSLASASNAEMTRWTGSTYASLISSFPVNAVMPGVKMWTARMPYQTTTLGRKTGTSPGGGTSTQLIGSGFVAGDDEKIAVILGGTGAGQSRRISAYVSATTLTVDPAWAVTPDSTSRYWVGWGGIVSSSTTTVITLTTANPPGLPAFTAGSVVTVFFGTGAPQQRTIASNTATTITVSSAFTTTPQAGDSVVVYDSGSRTVATYEGAWRDLTIYGDTAFVYTDGWEYSNTKSLPVYAPFAVQSTFGPMMELSWRLAQRFGEDIYWIHLAIPSAYMSRFFGTLANNDFAWYQNAKHNDWHPASVNTDGSDDLFGFLVNTVFPAARTALGSDTLDVQGIFAVEGESDSNVDGRYQLIRSNMEMIRDKLRQAITDQGMSSRQASRIPFIVAGMNETAWTYGAETNAEYAAMELDDTYTGFIEAADLDTVDSTQTHWNHDGAVEGGIRFYDKWVELMDRERATTTIYAKRQTLSAIRDNVLLRYEGNSVSTDATNAKANWAINHAQREILTKLGTRAWFLRRTETFTLTGSGTNPITLPGVVGTCIKIRSSSSPMIEYGFREVGRLDNGKQQIITGYSLSGGFLVDFIEAVSDMVGDDDECYIPKSHIELLELLAVKKLCESGGNQQLFQLIQAQIPEQWAILWKAVNANEQAGRNAPPYDDINLSTLGSSELPWL